MQEHNANAFSLVQSSFQVIFYPPAMKQLCLHLPLYQREKIASSFLCICLQKRSVHNDWGVSSARALWEVLVLSINSRSRVAPMPHADGNGVKVDA